jgi:hypothetical protein
MDEKRDQTIICILEIFCHFLVGNSRTNSKIYLVVPSHTHQVLEHLDLSVFEIRCPSSLRWLVPIVYLALPFLKHIGSVSQRMLLQGLVKRRHYVLQLVLSSSFREDVEALVRICHHLQINSSLMFVAK